MPGYITCSAMPNAVYDLWNNTTQNTSGVRIYTNTGSTDANGRITLTVTEDGTSGTAALFTAIYSIQATAGPSTFGATAGPFFFVDSVSADRKTIVIRGIKGTSLLALGATTVFAGSGLPAYITIIGLN